MFSLTLSGGKPPGPPYVSLSLSVSKNSRLSTQPQSFDLPESQLNSKQPSLSDLGKVETRESRRRDPLPKESSIEYGAPEKTRPWLEASMLSLCCAAPKKINLWHWPMTRQRQLTKKIGRAIFRAQAGVRDASLLQKDLLALKSFKSLGFTISLSWFSDLYRDLWFAMNDLFPRKLWASTVHFISTTNKSGKHYLKVAKVSWKRIAAVAPE